MPPGPPSLPALRQLLEQRFPSALRVAGAALDAGIPAVEAAGGLPRPGLTELVCSAPSCGSQLFLGQLLHAARSENLRVALVDRGDSFDPASWPSHLLEHVVWVRARGATEALGAADLLARDANLGLVVLDLRYTALVELRKLPAPSWYRLQRALEPARLAAVILTPCALVPSASLRLELTASHSLAAQNQPRPGLVLALAPEILRQRAASSASAG